MEVTSTTTLNGLPPAVAPSEPVEVDVVIVGAGLSGCYLLHKLRSRGFSVKVFETGSGLGGTWFWNRYPGARVDSTVPVYEYSIPEVWQSEAWSWKERFPARNELQSYFAHVDRILNLSIDVFFDERVDAATFDATQKTWSIQTAKGRTAQARWLILATGFAAKTSVPSWPGLHTFQGTVYHSASWPEDGVDLKGKKVGIVGTGSSGLQIAQTIADEVAELLVFQRTPNLALPLMQERLSPGDQKAACPTAFQSRLTTPSGHLYPVTTRKTFDDSEEERQAFYERLWQAGNFHFWVSNYSDLMTDLAANRAAYDFWAGKVRARIREPLVADLLAPVEPPHPFGAKRPALEWSWYDMFDQPGRKIVDIQNNPITLVDTHSVQMQDGSSHRLDALILATGFDSVTGGIKNIRIQGLDGRMLAEKWSDGTSTALGMMVAGFPNMFFTYGPQAPTAFANGPSCIEVQGDWLTEVLVDLRQRGLRSVDATPEGENRWKSIIDEQMAGTLYPMANSWWMGANVPGKKVEMLNYIGGLPEYSKELKRCRETDYQDLLVAP